MGWEVAAIPETSLVRTVSNRGSGGIVSLRARIGSNRGSGSLSLF